MEVTIGQPDIAASRLAFSSLEAAMKDLLDSKINAMVTAPINKHALRELKEFDYAGHTEYVTKSAGSPESLMMMCTEKLKVGVATGHIPLAQVPAAISKDMIERKVAILEKSLKKDFGIQKPKIAILGLNPHAGENGVLGKEELDHIIPAIEEIKSKGTLAFGPFASDGFFGTFAFKKYDGILAMYHDQGLIPFKTLAFEEGVNYTAGLPVIRTSPDHGTAYDIAGKDIADTTSFREAMYMAKAIAMNRVDN